jgi:hypothetical protein
MRLQRTNRRLKGISRTEHGATSFNGIKAFPDHAYYWTGSHVLDQTREEGLSLQIGVVYEIFYAINDGVNTTR